VISGNGEFVLEDVRMSFAPGTALFVPAGKSHRFENFTPDFATWVVFWGPEGGEA
jgi:mannose-6-phosphate isomerase-like protein (cupin superfamily)